MKTRRILLFMLVLASCLGLAMPAFANDTGTVGSYTTISGTSGHTAVIKADGSLWTWGEKLNTINTIEYYDAPVKLMDNVVSVSFGSQHAAVIKTDGSLWTWGRNHCGQLGNGTMLQDSDVATKVLDNVAAVSCGFYHTAAIKTDGTLWMWGYNNYGQLGNGRVGNVQWGNGSTFQTVPAKVMDDVAVVSCGYNYTAAVKTDGSLWMWGANWSNQLGNGGIGNAQDSLGAYQTVPVKVMDNVAYVTCDGNISGSTAVIKTDGSLWMWGDNFCGQLGTGDVETVAYPTKIMDDVAFVSCSGAHTGAIKTDGSLWMWGSNYYGQLGNGGEWNFKRKVVVYVYQTLPVKVIDHGVAAVSCGSITAAIKTDGSLWVWGLNGSGQLGSSEIGNATVNSPSGLVSIQTVPAQLFSSGVMALPASAPTSPTVAGFTDVHESDYYAQAVAWAKENGVTSGTSTTTFSPAASVTRAEAVTFLWRAAGSPEPSTMVSPFTDVTDSSAYYYKAILWAAEHDIAGGIGNNLFGLNNTLTYDQILALLCRTAGEDASGSDWSAAAVTWATKNGLTDGLTFTAKDNCPRADVVYCLWKQLA